MRVIKGRSMIDAFGFLQGRSNLNRNDFIIFGCTPNGPGYSSYSCIGCSSLTSPNG